MPLDVPEIYHRGFRDLANLDDVDFAALLSAYQNQQPTLFLNTADLLEKPLEKVDSDTVRRISDSLVSFVLGATELIEKSAPLAAEELAAAVTSSGDHASTDIRDRLRNRVEALIKLTPLRISVRALNLALANNRNYVAGRILTDLRPIFDGPKSIGFSNMLVLHKLQIQCTSDDNRYEDIIFTLDSNDLAQLSDQIQRAVDKENSLRQTLKDGIRVNILSRKSVNE